jgi:di/tripeptidase
MIDLKPAIARTIDDMALNHGTYGKNLIEAVVEELANTGKVESLDKLKFRSRNKRKKT